MVQEKTSQSVKSFSTLREETKEELQSKLQKRISDDIKTARGRLSEKLADIQVMRQIQYGSGGNIDGVFCKICGTQIAGLIEADIADRVEKINKQTIIYKRLVTAHRQNYREVRLVFDDQSAHITHCCADCVSKVLANPQEAWKQDMAQWAEDERRGLGNVRWDRYIDRTVIDAQPVENE